MSDAHDNEWLDEFMAWEKTLDEFGIDGEDPDWETKLAAAQREKWEREQAEQKAGSPEPNRAE